MRSSDSRNEKLTAIRILSWIGHRQQSSTCVLHVEILVLKLVAVDALSSSAIVVCEISALDHERFDDSVKAAAFVGQSTAWCCWRRGRADTKLAEVYEYWESEWALIDYVYTLRGGFLLSAVFGVISE